MEQQPDQHVSANLEVAANGESGTANGGEAQKRRRRVTRPAGGPAFSAVEPAKAPKAAPQPSGQPEAVEPRQQEDGTPSAPDSHKSPPTRGAATALLFQAPDLTPRKPRRAQAPAGPPREREADESQEERTASNQGAAAGSRSGTRESGAGQDAREGRGRRESGREQRRDGERAGGGSRTNRGGSADADDPGIAKSDRLARLELAELTKQEQLASDEVAVIEADILEHDDGATLAEFEYEDYQEDFPTTDVDMMRVRRRRGGRGKRTTGIASEPEATPAKEQANIAEREREHTEPELDTEAEGSRRRRRQRGTRADRAETRPAARGGYDDEVVSVAGSTRLEAKRQRRRENRQTARRRQILTEAEFLAHRENVERKMLVREMPDRTQIAVLEDGILVEHYVSQQSNAGAVGNVYLGRVQNVLPSMEAAFVDIGRGRNAVLYAGEVNWDAAGLESASMRRIEKALKSGDSVLVQVTKDPVGQKGARLTSQVTLAGRYLVYVPEGGMTGISRKLPEVERERLKRLLRDVVPDTAGVIVRTAAAGASEDELRNDVARLQAQWEKIKAKAEKSSTPAPSLLQGEPNLATRVVRDIFNDDFAALVISGNTVWEEIEDYGTNLPDELRTRVQRWNQAGDIFAAHRVDEQLAKGLDRKVWLPSGGSLVIDRTEAMTVIDVNTGKFTGAGGTLEETVTRNNLEAAEEIVRQLRLRDIGGIVVIDFIDMVLESNRDLVLRRLVESLGRDRTKHQVAEVTSLGLVQMTRKRVGQGLVEAFSTVCEVCTGRGYIVDASHSSHSSHSGHTATTGNNHQHGAAHAHHSHIPGPPVQVAQVPVLPDHSSPERESVRSTLATIAAAAAHAHELQEHPRQHSDDDGVPQNTLGDQNDDDAPKESPADEAATQTGE